MASNYLRSAQPRRTPNQPLNRTLDRALPALPLRSRAVKRRFSGVGPQKQRLECKSGRAALMKFEAARFFRFVELESVTGSA